MQFTTDTKISDMQGKLMCKWYLTGFTGTVKTNPFLVHLERGVYRMYAISMLDLSSSSLVT